MGRRRKHRKMIRKWQKSVTVEGIRLVRVGHPCSLIIHTSRPLAECNAIRTLLKPMAVLSYSHSLNTWYLCLEGEAGTDLVGSLVELLGIE
jgi:hypothetical protein